MADRIGERFGNYRLIRLLGRGGFAEVYLGEHMELGTQAAVKVLHAQLSSKDVERFNAEARTIARLAHPHIVRLLEFATEQGTPFLVMDYAPGGTLRERHPRGTPLPLETVLSYVRQVADALDYAHQEKLIHRDVKPENLLLNAKGQVLLGDFGIATVAQSSHSQSTQDALGTITYMAPEQIQGKPRPASDLYALGVIVYEWLTGEPPFSGSFGEIATQHLFVPPQPLRERVPTISEAVESVVLMALAKDPKERFANVQAFANALEAASQGAPAHLFAPTRITPPALADASTISVTPNNHPSAGVSQANAGQPAFNPFSTPTVPARPPSQPIGLSTRPTETKRPRRLLMSVLIAVLALLLVGTASAALILSRQPQSGGSGDSLTGNGVTATSAGGGASGPISGSHTATASPSGDPTNTPPGSTNTPTFGPTPTPPPGSTDTPTPFPTDTPPPGATNTPTSQPTPTNTPGPVLPTSVSLSASQGAAPNDTPITLIAQTNRPVDNTGYSIDIVQVSNQTYWVRASCGSGSRCTGVVSNNVGYYQYIAEVEKAPQSGVLVQSGNVFVAWTSLGLGFFSGSTSPVPSGTSVSIIAQTELVVLDNTGYYIDIIDETTGQRVCTTPGYPNGPTCIATVVSNSPASHTYIAYIEQGYESGIVVQSGTLTVTWT